MAFALERRAEFGLGFLLWLRGDGAEQADLVLPQQLDGALGKGIAFLDPALPADVGVDVFGLEADGVEHPNRLGQDLIANAVSGHGYDGMFCHECVPLVVILSGGRAPALAAVRQHHQNLSQCLT